MTSDSLVLHRDSPYASLLPSLKVNRGRKRKKQNDLLATQAKDRELILPLNLRNRFFMTCSFMIENYSC